MNALRRYNPKTPKQEANAFIDGVFRKLVAQKVLTKKEVPTYRKAVVQRLGKRIERIFEALNKLENEEYIKPFQAPAPKSGKTYSEAEWQKLVKRMDTKVNDGAFENYNAYHYHLLTKHFFMKVESVMGMNTSIHMDWQNVIFEPVLERARAMEPSLRTPKAYMALHNNLVERLHQWEAAIVELDESNVLTQDDLELTPKQINALRSAYLSPYKRNTGRIVEGLLQCGMILRYWSMNRQAARDLVDAFLRKNISWKKLVGEFEKAGR